MRSERWLAGAVACVAVWVVAGCGAGTPPVRVEDPWIRPVETGQTTAAYFTLVNDSPDTLVLVGVDVPIAQMSMMHETVKVEGMMTMREKDRFAVAPHSKLLFKPGGNHVMAMEAVVGVAEGDTTGIELRFANGRSLHATAKVHT